MLTAVEHPSICGIIRDSLVPGAAIFITVWAFDSLAVGSEMLWEYKVVKDSSCNSIFGGTGCASPYFSILYQGCA